MSPPIPVGAENIPICMSSLWPDISAQSVYQDNETSSGCTNSAFTLAAGHGMVQHSMVQYVFGVGLH